MDPDGGHAERRSAALLLNAQGISPAATSSSRWKLPIIADTLLNDPKCFVPFMCITETYLKSYITDAQVKVPNYVSFRADRTSRIQGGALIFTHDSFLTSNVFKYDDEVCEAVGLQIDSLKLVVICAYRPPDASYKSFTSMLSKMRDYLEQVDNTYERYITGDFNLPNIN